MSKPNSHRNFWFLVKDVQIPRVVLQSVHDSEKSALSAQRKNGGRVVKIPALNE